MIMTRVTVYKEPDTVHSLDCVFRKGHVSLYLSVHGSLDSPLASKRQFILNGAHSQERGKHGSRGMRGV